MCSATGSPTPRRESGCRRWSASTAAVPNSLSASGISGSWNAPSRSFLRLARGTLTIVRSNAGRSLFAIQLNCALRTAVDEIAPKANTAGAWEVVYTAIEKLGTYFDDRRDELQDERGIAPALALQLFNNRPGTTVKDVIGVLEEARDRIRAELRRKAK
jgi:hypothetical protein